MKVICAWCKKNMADKEPREDQRVSHGMCPECVEAERINIEKYWQESHPAAVSAAGY